MERALQAYEKRILPPMMILDVTNLCNLKCVHCPQPALAASPGYRPAFMRMDHFEKIMENIERTGEPILVRLVGDGEPLLHPDITAMIRRAAAIPCAVVNLTTNGLAMRPKMADQILDAGVRLVDFSIDALTKPVYQKVRLGGSYEKLMRNIFYFLEKNGKGAGRAKTMVSFITQDENAEESGKFREFWSPLVDYVMVRSLHSAAGRVKTAESAGRNQAALLDRYPCPHLWKRLTVDFEGNIKFCAHDWGRDTVLGHMDSTDPVTVWAGGNLGKIRAQHLANRFDAHHLCAGCSDWASTRWDYGYEKLVDKLVFGAPTLYPFDPAG